VIEGVFYLSLVKERVNPPSFTSAEILFFSSTDDLPPSYRRELPSSLFHREMEYSDV